MKIETLDDWNAILTGCNCCAMPECPLPTRESQAASASICGLTIGATLGGTPGDYANVLCKKVETTYSLSINAPYGTTNETSGYTWQEFGAKKSGDTSDCNLSLSGGGSGGGNSYYDSDNTLIQVEDSSSWTLSLVSGVPTITTTGTVTEYDTGGVVTSSTPYGPTGTTITYAAIFGGAIGDQVWTGFSCAYSTDSGDGDGTATYTPALLADVTAAFGAITIDAGDYATTTTPQAALDVTYLEIDGEVDPFIEDASAAWMRFRWVVPDTWEGSYFKITWDVVEEPEGWDADPPTAPRSFFLTDQTWTWAGPGDTEDEDSWKSGWYEVEPPDVPGVRRVVNIRFECYQSAKFGVKPQVTGDAVEIPAP